MCGSKKISRVVETLSLPTPGGAISVSGIELDRCRNCGEGFLDSAASRKIDSMMLPNQRSPRRRKTA
jgi:YgiT-type zinc finger domain-containing protein